MLLLFSEKTKESNQASSKLKSRPKPVKKGTSADLLFQRVGLDTKFASKHADLSMSECFVLLVLSLSTTLVLFFFFFFSTLKRNQPFSETTHHTGAVTVPFFLSCFLFRFSSTSTNAKNQNLLVPSLSFSLLQRARSRVHATKSYPFQL